MSTNPDGLCLFEKRDERLAKKGGLLVSRTLIISDFTFASFGVFYIQILWFSIGQYKEVLLGVMLCAGGALWSLMLVRDRWERDEISARDVKAVAQIV